MKQRFLENLKTIPFDPEKLNTLEFQPLQQAFEYICENKHTQASALILDYIKTELEKRDTTNNNIPIKMLVVSEIPSVNTEIRDLALDIMLMVEEEELSEDILSRIDLIKSQIV